MLHVFEHAALWVDAVRAVCFRYACLVNLYTLIGIRMGPWFYCYRKAMTIVKTFVQITWYCKHQSFFTTCWWIPHTHHSYNLLQHGISKPVSSAVHWPTIQPWVCPPLFQNPGQRKFVWIDWFIGNGHIRLAVVGFYIFSKRLNLRTQVQCVIVRTIDGCRYNYS